jgi:hypothetical protein
MILMGFLSKPAHKSSDPEVRLEAVWKIEDQTTLAELARTDPSPRVRKAAIERLVDQDLLVEVALEGDEIDSRIAAVEKVESQRRLAEIIKLRKNYKLMGACFARITDRDILSDIANDPGYNMTARRMAIEGFADESYLSEIAIEEPRGARPKTPEEIDALVKRHGADKLVRALGRFRGSKAAIMALGELMRRGGEAAGAAVEYLAQALAHANPGVSQTASEQLSSIRDGELVARLIAQMDNPSLHDRILHVLGRIDHPDARQIAGDAE